MVQVVEELLVELTEMHSNQVKALIKSNNEEMENSL